MLRDNTKVLFVTRLKEHYFRACFDLSANFSSFIEFKEFMSHALGWRQDNRNRSSQESKFDFLATRQCLVKIDEGQQKIKIVHTNRQSNLWASCQSIFSLCQHHPSHAYQDFNLVKFSLTGSGEVMVFNTSKCGKFKIVWR